MISDTHTPLNQLVEWMGFNPYTFNGIDIGGDTIPAPTGYDKTITPCDCILQKSYYSPSNITRDEIIGYLKKAEEIFFAVTDIYLSPYQLEEEKHGLKSIYFKNSCYFIKPEYLCELRQYGLQTPQYIGFVSVDKTDPNIFEIVFTVPSGTNLEDIRIYFRQNDYGYDLDYNLHEYEIRPLNNISILADEVTIRIEPYLLKDPALNDELECLANVPETYVDTVDIYIWTNDQCQQAKIVCEGSCDTVPCQKVYYDACLDEHSNWGSNRVCVTPATCTDGVFKRSNICNCKLNGLNINYQSGYKLQKNRYIDKNIFNNIIAPLTVGLMFDYFKNFCNCDTRLLKRIDMYREVATYNSRVERGRGEGRDEVEKRILLTSKMLEKSNGMLPTLGYMSAMKAIEDISCFKLQGGYF